jgi:hypothetical protein
LWADSAAEVSTVTGYVIVRVAVFEVPLKLAEIAAPVLAPTFVVLIVNVAEVLPAAMVTAAGTVALDELLDSEIVNPPVGAATLILTVPVAVLPPATLVGLKDNEVSEGGLIVRVACATPPFRLPSIVAAVCFATAIVFTVNVAATFPAGTVTVAGSVAELVLLERWMTMPPVGAGPLSVTVPADDALPVTVDGDKVIDERTGGITVTAAVTDTVPSWAITVAAF